MSTTLSTEPRTVEATIWVDNLSGGPAGISLVELYYSIDTGKTFHTIEMIYIDSSKYSADIPGQSPGTYVTYYIEATDLEGNKHLSIPISYSIFVPTENVNTLLIFDGQPESGYPSSYYFGHDDFVNFTTVDFPHDVWAFGQITEELLNNYKNVFEFVSIKWSNGFLSIRSGLSTWRYKQLDRCV